MSTTEKPAPTADGLSRRVKAQAVNGRLVEYLAVSYRIVEVPEGGRQVEYMAHTMDMATRKLVPHHLGSGEAECSHRKCNMGNLFALAAVYAVESAWSPEEAAADQISLPIDLWPSGG